VSLCFVESASLYGLFSLPRLIQYKSLTGSQKNHPTEVLGNISDFGNSAFVILHLIAKRVVGCNLRAEERSGLGGLEFIRMSAIFPPSLCLRFSLPVMIGQKVSIAL
jgi:hypothetical protein